MPGPASVPVALRVRADGQRLVVEGDVDVFSAPQLVAAVEEAIERRPERLVLDLRAVGLADSTGLAALIRCRRRAHVRDVALVLDVGDGPVARVLRLTRLDRVFALVTD